ncbi:MAG: hypothetical protein ACRDZO_22895 [Egibacteraceae bacterium]
MTRTFAEVHDHRVRLLQVSGQAQRVHLLDYQRSGEPGGVERPSRRNMAASDHRADLVGAAQHSQGGDKSHAGERNSLVGKLWRGQYGGSGLQTS